MKDDFSHGFHIKDLIKALQSLRLTAEEFRVRDAPFDPLKMFRRSAQGLSASIRDLRPVIEKELTDLQLLLIGQAVLNERFFQRRKK